MVKKQKPNLKKSEKIHEQTFHKRQQMAIKYMKKCSTLCVTGESYSHNEKSSNNRQKDK